MTKDDDKRKAKSITRPLALGQVRQCHGLIV